MNNPKKKKMGKKVLPKTSAPMKPWATNLDQTPIAITEDKLRLILLTSANALGTRRNWTTPFGILLSCITVLTTTEKFKSLFELDMKTLFVFGLIASAIWLIRDLYRLFKHWHDGNIDCIVRNIMNKPTKNKHK